MKSRRNDCEMKKKQQQQQQQQQIQMPNVCIFVNRHGETKNGNDEKNERE